MAIKDKIGWYASNNKRFFAVMFFMLAIFLLNSVFSDKITRITGSRDRQEKEGYKSDVSSISDLKKAFFVNDIFNSQPGEYYRLSFRENTTGDSRIIVKATNAFDHERLIGEFELKKTERNSFHELLFYADGPATDILFEKSGSDGADIIINGVQVTKLELKNNQEFSSLQPTIWGEIKTDNPDQWQKKNDFAFNQLKFPDTVLGQIFKPESEYISSVTVDLDVIKQNDNGGKYKFELREAEFDGGVPEISSNVVSSIDFTLENIERFRQDDGKLKFPVFSKLDPEKYYFFGINNNNTSVDSQNYIRLRGTDDKNAYADGIVAVKTKGKTYSAIGNLYFITNQFNFTDINGKNILTGETIEDLGGGNGFFTYKPMGNNFDLADLDQYSPDVFFDYDKKTLAGKINDNLDSYMIYKFRTLYPATSVRIYGRQKEKNWSRLSLSFSYDGMNWQKIPDITESDENTKYIPQRFDYSWDIVPAGTEVYIKITPESGDNKKYGMDEFRVEAKLTIKQK